jgi:hypothetical protein
MQTNCEACDVLHDEFGYYCKKCQEAIDKLHEEMKNRESDLTPEETYELSLYAARQVRPLATQ